MSVCWLVVRFVGPLLGRSVVTIFSKGMVVTLPCSYRSTCFPNKSADRCPAGRAPSLPLQQAVLRLPQGPEQVATRLISHTYAPTILYHTVYSFFGPVSPYDGITISKKQVQ